MRILHSTFLPAIFCQNVFSSAFVAKYPPCLLEAVTGVRLAVVTAYCACAAGEDRGLARDWTHQCTGDQTSTRPEDIREPLSRVA